MRESKIKNREDGGIGKLLISKRSLQIASTNRFEAQGYNFKDRYLSRLGTPKGSRNTQLNSGGFLNRQDQYRKIGRSIDIVDKYKSPFKNQRVSSPQRKQKFSSSVPYFLTIAEPMSRSKED